MKKSKTLIDKVSKVPQKSDSVKIDVYRINGIDCPVVRESDYVDNQKGHYAVVAQGKNPKLGFSTLTRSKVLPPTMEGKQREVPKVINKEFQVDGKRANISKPQRMIGDKHFCYRGFFKRISKTVSRPFEETLDIQAKQYINEVITKEATPMEPSICSSCPYEKDLPIKDKLD